MECPNVAGLECFHDGCPGRTDPAACRFHRLMTRRRAMTEAERAAEAGAARPAVDPGARDRVLACPDRGPEGGAGLAGGCCGGGPELTECRAGKGERPGRVTLRECLGCRS